LFEQILRQASCHKAWERIVAEITRSYNRVHRTIISHVFKPKSWLSIASILCRLYMAAVAVAKHLHIRLHFYYSSKMLKFLSTCCQHVAAPNYCILALLRILGNTYNWCTTRSYSLTPYWRTNLQKIDFWAKPSEQISFTESKMNR
jgi:hypothetical protein